MMWLLFAGCTWIDADELSARIGKAADDPDLGADLNGDGFTSVLSGGDDCWDDPSSTADRFASINGLPELSAADVHSAADDVPYDAIDADCDSDFDQDADGYTSDTEPDREGSVGLDRDDDDAAVRPDAAEDWYDGIDGDCSGVSDYDADLDGYDLDRDCDGDDNTVNPGATEVCENGIDDDCDGGFAGCLGSRSLSAADAQYTGEAASDVAGISASTAGDVDGDGFVGDLLIGAPYNSDAETQAGAAYLVLGSGL